MGNFYSTVVLFKNEDVIGNSVPTFVLLLVICRFSLFYNIRINEFVIFRNSFSILYSGESMDTAICFMTALKKNFIYWCRRGCGTDICYSSNSATVELESGICYTQCAFELLKRANMDVCLLSSLDSHYNCRNIYRLDKKNWIEFKNMLIVMQNIRSRLGDTIPYDAIGRRYIDVTAFLNLDTSRIDSIFSFKTFKEIVNLHIK
ncbi:MAG: hypothetical protein II344_02430 [Bacteroidales bacterium]|nr:hypothetical protein [Bacteroidales bacterium]